MEITREEFIQKCKKEARDYYQQTGNLKETMACFLSDLNKREDTANHPAAAIMLQLYIMGDLRTQESMFKFIDGFN
jgi:hypothetical protein